MNSQNKYMIFCAIILIVAPIVLSTLSSDKITASDWTYRHSVWIKDYLHGNYSAITSYPPLFHVMMLPFVAVGFPVKYFQIIFALLSTLGILWMTKKLHDEKTLLFVSILLASSIAFVEFASALMPQALDWLLFPVAIVLYFRGDRKFVIPLILDMGMHMTGFIFIGILFLHSLVTKRTREMKILFILLLIMTPIFLHYTFFSPMDKFWDYQAQDLWDAQFFDPLWKFFAVSGFLTWILLPYASKKLYDVKFKLSDMQLLYVLWIVAFFSFIPFHIGIWRMISYQIVPLSLLVASVVSK